MVFATTARLTGILREFAPDVVHLASPFVLGWQGVCAADALRIPTVAIYQTDVVAYTAKYGMPQATTFAAGHVTRLHRRATLTLAPSSSSIEQLESLGVDRLRRWGRGVDAERFRPERRSDAWRERVAPGELIVGYVGRLAPEKQVEDLRALADLPGARLVIVGDGPARAAQQRLMPNAVFLGHLSGDALGEAVASFDVFVHPGESETFGQTIQEALASGVPVVATGRGGPVDLVRSSVDGWLYRPGDLDDLRARVADLLGDAAKRRAFAAAARESVRERTWAGPDPAIGGALRGGATAASHRRRAARPRIHSPLGAHRPNGCCSPTPLVALRGPRRLVDRGSVRHVAHASRRLTAAGPTAWRSCSPTPLQVPSATPTWRCAAGASATCSRSSCRRPSRSNPISSRCSWARTTSSHPPPTRCVSRPTSPQPSRDSARRAATSCW